MGRPKKLKEIWQPEPDAKGADANNPPKNNPPIGVVHDSIQAMPCLRDHSDPNKIEVDRRKLVHLQNLFVDLQKVPMSNEVYYVIKHYHDALREILSLPSLEELVDKRLLEHREIQGLLSPKYICTCQVKKK